MDFENLTEEWRDIKGYEGLYQVSNKGRVRSIPRNSTVKNIRIIRPAKFAHGYLGVGLNKNGKRASRTVHRLVAETFMPIDNKKLQVNHIDGDRTNNSLENLEWVTPSYNSWHRNNVLGVKAPNVIPVECIETGEKYESFKDAHDKTGVHRVSLQRFFKGEYKTAGGYRWRKI